MSARDPKIMLSEILESIAAIHSYLNGVSKEDFMTTAVLQDAVIRRLEVIGEAAGQIPDDVKSRFPTVEWRAITAMRNRLIHAYFSVNLDIVWNTTQRDLPTLEAQAQSLLRLLEQEQAKG